VLRAAVIVSPERLHGKKTVLENASKQPSVSIRNEAVSSNRPKVLGARLSVPHPSETYETIFPSVEFAHDAKRCPEFVNWQPRFLVSHRRTSAEIAANSVSGDGFRNGSRKMCERM
jgi:hypothetical protein